MIAISISPSLYFQFDGGGIEISFFLVFSEIFGVLKGSWEIKGWRRPAI
jgi:hypothetical protein